jgi:hypothetical protein
MGRDGQSAVRSRRAEGGRSSDRTKTSGPERNTRVKGGAAEGKNGRREGEGTLACRRSDTIQYDENERTDGTIMVRENAPEWESDEETEKARREGERAVSSRRADGGRCEEKANTGSDGGSCVLSGAAEGKNGRQEGERPLACRVSDTIKCDENERMEGKRRV